MDNTLRADPLAPPLPASAKTGVHRWGRLYGSAGALAIANAARAHRGPTLVLAGDATVTEQLVTEISFFAGPTLRTLHFPDVETLPYDAFSPHQELVAERLTTLAELPDLTGGVVVADAAAILRRMPPTEFIRARSLVLRRKDRIDPGALRARLVSAGYHHVSQVMERGEFAVRGALIDLFPPSLVQPVRLDLFDDEIETLRLFDVKTQRSQDRMDDLTLLPAREYPLDADGIGHFRQQYRRRFEGDPTQAAVYRDVSDGIAGGGVENYLPLFFEHTASFADYLPATTLVIELMEARDSASAAYDEIAERYEQLGHDTERPLLTPEELYVTPDEAFEALRAFPCIRVGRFESTDNDPNSVNFATETPPDFNLGSAAREPTKRLRDFVDGFDGALLLVAESPGRRETLTSMLRDQQLHPTAVADWAAFVANRPALAVTVAPLQEGLLIDTGRLAVIAENQLFGTRARTSRRQRRQKDPQAVIRDLADLRLGAPVVHEAYGIGRYEGLTHLSAGGIDAEYLTLTYADGDRLYVPVHALHLISRYTGASAETAPLHRLGSDQWDRARRKATRKIRDVAAELLDLYARRAARVGQSMKIEPQDYLAFAAGFPFEPTADQAVAIDQVVDDMTSLKPMDRLVCGDVGFGKTEVALRAAFVGVQNDKQVALLVPTTLLAQQHGQTFADRFADWPINIAVLSRFRSRKEIDAILAGVAAGQVDIVIGTHRLLQKDVKFRDLGLVIIDEEHRFGVRHKERLKALRSEVDVMTLTATPIPRTLNLAMGGLRDMSLITTPPADRLSIKTFVTTWNNTLIREACLREIKRGGQIFFVHNTVKSIDETAAKVAKLVPEANLEIGHGQMRERDLERVMLDFYHRRFNLLVCTTIIESGIDIPTANTIIINRADRFGLAQLHQLRGRVGRSNRNAFAYLITPPLNQLTPDAVKRLEAIESLEDLGAGFALASHDLEIRGAGELLGEEQSGQIHEIGFTMYMQLLDRAVRSLREGKEPNLDELPGSGVEIDLHVPAFFPDDYLPDVHMRLVQYKRIASAADKSELRELKVEMIDRFGLIPDQARPLFDLAELRIRCAPLGIERLEAGDASGRIVFEPRADVDPGALIKLLQTEPQIYRFDGDRTLRFRADMEEPAQRFRFVHQTLKALSGTA